MMKMMNKCNNEVDNIDEDDQTPNKKGWFDEPGAPLIVSICGAIGLLSVALKVPLRTVSCSNGENCKYTKRAHIKNTVAYFETLSIQCIFLSFPYDFHKKMYKESLTGFNALVELDM